MKGDFSRVSFDRSRHFSQVLMQQGRVLLADDLNESSDIFSYLLRAFIRDMVGPYAGPLAETGFEIIGLDTTQDTFTIGGGRYYVGGLLCVNEGTLDENGNPKHYTYRTQPNYQPDPKEELKAPLVIYLDAWERHVSAVEMDAIREKALGGADTATRAQIVWQVRTGVIEAGLTPPPEATPDVNGTDQTSYVGWFKTIDGWFGGLTSSLQPDDRGYLSARLRPDAGAYKDPCITPPKAGYRGETNQLYRVEISAVTKDDQATFRWSRENGSVATNWLDTDGKDLIVTSSNGFSRQDWVELLDDGDEWAGQTGRLFQVDGVAPGRITLVTTPGAPAEGLHARVRRWDQKFTANARSVDGSIPITEASNPGGDKTNWIDLENGIQVQFRPPKTGKNAYRPGDYWLIPVRVGTGIDLPGKLVNDVWESDAVEPKGVTHYYAPLAFFDGANLTDLRRVFAPSLTRARPSVS